MQMFSQQANETFSNITKIIGPFEEVLLFPILSFNATNQLIFFILFLFFNRDTTMVKALCMFFFFFLFYLSFLIVDV